MMTAAASSTWRGFPAATVVMALATMLLFLPSAALATDDGESSECPNSVDLGGSQGSSVNTELGSCGPAAGDPEQVDDPGAGGGDIPDGMPIVVRVGTVDDEGEVCLGWNTVWIDQPHHAHEVLTAEVLDLNAWMADNGLHDEGLVAEARLNGDGADLLPDCPSSHGVDPQVVRELVVHELPVPDPATQPDWALTGMPTYLEIGAAAEYDRTLTGELLPVAVTVSGHATYRVDWGDGTITEHTSSGGPYPDGDVVRTYADASDEDVEITVTPVWQLEWSAAGLTMPLEIVLEPATYQLPVREMQAVRSAS